jgi:aromatic ring-opening dioxygenase catalytic subunit (LigB family)
MTKLPTLFIPHGGGPCFYMDWTMGPPDTWDRMAAWLRALASTLPERPKALLVVSAHWETELPTVSTAVSPSLLYDYSGFPPHTYELRWPVPGSPELAAQVRGLLESAAIPSLADDRRGLDHGVFVPLKLSFPEAQTPVVQLSLQRGLDPRKHRAIGRALAPLREQGVLIVASGMSYHNMRGFMSADGLKHSQRFDDYLSDAVAQPAAKRDALLDAWHKGPSARQSHPREEHLLPLMVAGGAAGEDTGKVVFRDQVMGVVVSAVQFG